MESEIQVVLMYTKFVTYTYRGEGGSASSVWLKILNYGLSAAKALFKTTFSKMCFVEHFLMLLMLIS